MQIAICILTCILLIGCSPAQQTVSSTSTTNDQPDVREVASTYKNLNLMTKERVFVDPKLAWSCVGATQAQVQAARRVSGPHANTAILVYMNDLAAGAFGKAD